MTDHQIIRLACLLCEEDGHSFEAITAGVMSDYMRAARHSLETAEEDAVRMHLAAYEARASVRKGAGWQPL